MLQPPPVSFLLQPLSRNLRGPCHRGRAWGRSARHHAGELERQRGARAPLGGGHSGEGDEVVGGGGRGEEGSIGCGVFVFWNLPEAEFLDIAC